MSKVLITVPDLSRPGGVSSLFNILKLDELNDISYFQIHGVKSKNPVARGFDLIFIFFKFFFTIGKYQVVHVNPSFTSKSYLRDAVFVYLARLRGKKVMVYWHGWDHDYEEKVKGSSLAKLFKKTYAKADISIVLGSVFATSLRSLGCAGKIQVESNAASDTYIDGNITAKSLEKNRQVVFLFIARLERTKGVYIAIDTIHGLATDYNIKLVVAGDGPEFEGVRKYIAEKNLTNIEAIGYVNGKEKHNAFFNADVLLLPTYHKEGMPISIIEGMLYGLPVITRPVGGIPDWVKNGDNGYVIDSLDPADFSFKINELLADEKQFNAISRNNIAKAREFTPTAVTKRLKLYYNELTVN